MNVIQLRHPIKQDLQKWNETNILVKGTVVVVVDLQHEKIQYRDMFSHWRKTNT